MTCFENTTEYSEIESLMENFFESYYINRDSAKVAEMVTDDIMFVGLSPREVCYDKASFLRCVNVQMSDVTNSVQYLITDHHQTNYGGGLWNYYGTIRLRVTSGNWGIVRYTIRLMAVVRKIGGVWKIISVHVSEITGYTMDREGLRFSTDTAENDNLPVVMTQHQIAQFFNHLIPGGVISRISTEGFPIVIANNQYLKMIGYSSFREYSQDQNGLFINSIHPDDVEKYIYAGRFISTTGKQYESEYRIRRKDGSYLWVHDVGCMAVSEERKEIIISIVTDMSDQIEKRHKLELENGIDFLTQVFNRKGAVKCIENHFCDYSRSLFSIIDLDNFKLVNDLYGHVIGDEVLKYTAELLSAEFGENGVVCRLGGDEFAVFVPNYDSIDTVKKKLRKITATYVAYTAHTCANANSSLSIGGVFGSRKACIREQYQKADQNLYKIKKSSKGDMLFTSFDD